MLSVFFFFLRKHVLYVEMVYIMLGKRNSIILGVNSFVLLNLQIKSVLKLNCHFYWEIRNSFGGERLNFWVLIFFSDKTLNFSLDNCKARPFFLTTINASNKDLGDDFIFLINKNVISEGGAVVFFIFLMVRLIFYFPNLRQEGKLFLIFMANKVFLIFFYMGR